MAGEWRLTDEEMDALDDINTRPKDDSFDREMHDIADAQTRKLMEQMWSDIQRVYDRDGDWHSAQDAWHRLEALHKEVRP